VSEGKQTADSFLPFEVNLLVTLRLDYRLLSIGLFLIMTGSFLAIASLTHTNGFQALKPGGDLFQEVELAIVFCALLTVAIALQTAGHNLWKRELKALRDALRPGFQDRLDPFESGLPVTWRKAYRVASLSGLAAGIALNCVIVSQASQPLSVITEPVGIWFLTLGPILFILGARGLTDMSCQSRFVKDLIHEAADIDLADLEKLQVFGRMGLHEALSWSLIAAVLILMLAAGISSGGVGVLGIGLLTIALAIGGAVRSFWLAIQPVQRRIASAKAEKLKALRAGILKARENVGDLIALENWIASRPEWPISAPISRRLLIYVALPLLAWAGAALVDRGVNALIS
jgi:hypothetical protein